MASAVAPLNQKLNEQKIQEALKASKAKIAEQVNSSALPQPAKTRLIESLSSVPYEDEAKLVEAVKTAVTAELTYLTEAAGIKPGVKEGQVSTAKTLADGLSKRLGLKVEEAK